MSLAKLESLVDRFVVLLAVLVHAVVGVPFIFTCAAHQPIRLAGHMTATRVGLEKNQPSPAPGQVQTCANYVYGRAPGSALYGRVPGSDLYRWHGAVLPTHSLSLCAAVICMGEWQ